ncbi:50S ribosomal protein L11 methyltransferase [Larkinella humicola]|uniref:Ribosomal protein L11 methyltransferase n=1 Tax=Larkinella humicola TaxID=2607654 RepID=A0A5N1JG85_9BACT|nr:50S ribosomal protein L11 methyltransferase [Larkinella humicola]KAA9352758.1 50S ribosomal protein L11 methyltransferase [Larkinella humicola]
MNYTELQLTLAADYTDIFMAELGALGFESFVETDEGLNAYISESAFDETAVQSVIDKYANQTAIAYQINSLEKKNWNEEWERNYQPIDVQDRIRVRASFHEPDAGFRYDIVINPKMSFGTGHHETTAMMLEHQLSADAAGKTVLDVGSGTGILAILSALQGAERVIAFDIEEWAIENARENAELNGCSQIDVFQGTIHDVNPAERFDLVLANINRNVLLEDIPVYVRLMKPESTLLVSGFYEQDAPDIEEKGLAEGLTKTGQLSQNKWVSLRFIKSTHGPAVDPV